MGTRWQIGLIGIFIGIVAIFGFSLVDVSSGDEIGAVTLFDTSSIADGEFTQAIEPYEWDFPRDFGPHPDFQTEWWYYTGNLATDEGRRFGFQFTIFRRAIASDATETESEWRTNQVYVAHFTISDIETQTFYHDDRISRSSAALAGAEGLPYRVWLEDWEILAQNEDASTVTIQADAENFSIDLTLNQLKPPALQGDGGLSPKSDVEGNASYYYTLSRLDTSGTITLKDEQFDVSGFSWKDHEFSTSALGAEAQGWDWFGLIFDDNREMMIGQIRLTDGGKETAFGGLMIYPDGSTEYLPSDQISITPTETWLSPHTNAEYPAAWNIQVDTSTGTLEFNVTPLMLDQELSDTDPSYWEGAVRVEGDVNGYGYAELTGYTDSMQNRF